MSGHHQDEAPVVCEFPSQRSLSEPIQRKFVFSYFFVVTESSSSLLISLSGILPTALGKLLGQHCAHFCMGQTEAWKERVLVEATEKVKDEAGMGTSGQMLCFAPSSLSGVPLMTNPSPWLAWGIGGICPWTMLCLVSQGLQIRKTTDHNSAACSHPFILQCLCFLLVNQGSMSVWGSEGPALLEEFQ